MKLETRALVVTMFALAFTGLLMVYSVGAMRSPDAEIFKKHLVYLSAGFVGFLFLSVIDYHHFGKPAVFTYVVSASLLLLFLTFVPGFRLSMGGASRWIGWRFVSFQPSELAKFAMVLLLAVRLTQYQDKIRNFFTGFIMPFMIAGIFVGIVILQRDIGIPLVMLAATFTMVWVAGARKIYLIGSGILAVMGMTPLVLLRGYRAERIIAFIDPWSYRQETGYQLIQSMSAFAQGGFWGRGAGAGEQKLGYLPAAHTDFIYAMIGEELGFVGTLLTLTLFVIMMYASIRIAMNAPDLFGSLLATGICTLINFQALFIMSVTLGLLPTKGLPLPFVSYGGSALLISMSMMGVLFNIGVQSHALAEGRKPRLAPLQIRKMNGLKSLDASAN